MSDSECELIIITCFIDEKKKEKNKMLVVLLPMFYIITWEKVPVIGQIIIIMLLLNTMRIRYLWCARTRKT